MSRKTLNFKRRATEHRQRDPHTQAPRVMEHIAPGARAVIKTLDPLRGQSVKAASEPT